jgi:hypothetical protein
VSAQATCGAKGGEKIRNDLDAIELIQRNDHRTVVESSEVNTGSMPQQ